MRAPRSIFVALLLLLAASPLDAQERRPFTPEDALRVRSLQVQDVSSDGRWIAATVVTPRDRMNVDHFRFGDPTYVAPSTAEFIVIDADSGEERPIVPGRVQVRGAEWSPEGDALAFFLREGERWHLHLFDPASGSARRVALDTELAIASNSRLAWRPGGEGLLIDLRAEGWAEAARAAFVEMTEGPIVVQDASEPFLEWDRVRMMGRLIRPTLVDRTGAVEVLLPEGQWGEIVQSADGEWLAIEGEVPLRTVYVGREGSENRLLRMNLDSRDTIRVVEPSTRNISATWAPDGTRYVFADEGKIHLRSIFEDSASVLTEAFAGRVSESNATEEPDTTELRFRPMQWRPDGGALLVESQEGWHLLDPEAGEMELIHPLDEKEREEGPRLDVFAWSPDGRYLYVSESARDEWRRGIARLDLESGAWQRNLVERNTFSGWRLTDDGRRLVFEMSDGDAPDELHLLDADLSTTSLESARRLTDLNPWLDEVALTRSELVEYLDVDGKKLYGLLYYPLGYVEGERYPLVAEVYEEFFDNGFNSNMNLITSRGWFGFRPSVKFEEGFPGEAWLKGVTTGINTLIGRGLVDGERLGVHGTSYGGYAVNLLVTQTDRFAAAINISGKVNIISFLGDSEKITTRNYRAAESGQDRIGATLWEQPQKYIEHSAILFADRIDTPLLLLSGEGDWNVPATNQREMYYALRRLEKEVVWVNYMKAGHGAGRAGGETEWFDQWERIFEWYGTHFDEAVAERPVTEEEGAG